MIYNVSYDDVLTIAQAFYYTALSVSVWSAILNQTK